MEQGYHHQQIEVRGDNTLKIWHLVVSVVGVLVIVLGAVISTFNAHERSDSLLDKRISILESQSVMAAEWRKETSAQLNEITRVLNEIKIDLNSKKDKDK